MRCSGLAPQLPALLLQHRLPHQPLWLHLHHCRWCRRRRVRLNHHQVHMQPLRPLPGGGNHDGPGLLVQWRHRWLRGESPAQQPCCGTCGWICAAGSSLNLAAASMVSWYSNSLASAPRGCSLAPPAPTPAPCAEMQHQQPLSLGLQLPGLKTQHVVRSHLGPPSGCSPPAQARAAELCLVVILPVASTARTQRAAKPHHAPSLPKHPLSYLTLSSTTRHIPPSVTSLSRPADSSPSPEFTIFFCHSALLFPPRQRVAP